MEVSVAGCIVLFKHFLVRSNKNHDFDCYDNHFGIEIIYLFIVFLIWAGIAQSI
jgi:hypothetical protein